MGRLILFDTCNYRDYPVGGQVTSIKNFLKYIEGFHSNHIEDILLVGVSTKKEDIGVIKKIRVNDKLFNFLAVTHASTNQSKVKKSLRLEYIKGLFKYRKLLKLKTQDCMYIHTPEAFMFVKIICSKATCFVFSHGTYIDMWKRVRFFKKSFIIRKLFQRYLEWVIKKCDTIFVLENETYIDYSFYNQNVVHVGNSIICQEYFERTMDNNLVKFVYAGRLSKVKNIGPIIEAIKSYPKNVELIILGAGEMLEELIALSDERIHFLGAVSPDQVKEYMRECDILIMNSIFEGIPMTILEAISLGLPVITTDVGGIKEILNYGVDSEKTDGTIPSIHRAMEKIILNYNSYSKAAYNQSQKFDYKIVNEKIFNIINEKLNWI